MRLRALKFMQPLVAFRQDEKLSVIAPFSRVLRHEFHQIDIFALHFTDNRLIVRSFRDKQGLDAVSSSLLSLRRAW